MVTAPKDLFTLSSDISRFESMGWFGLKCALFFAPLLALLTLSAVSLSIVGELTTPEHVLALQRSAPVLFDQMYQPKNTYPAYKLLGARETRPRVLALGTSRIFGLRHEFVRESAAPFYNGYIFSARVGAMRKFLEHLPSDQLPHSVILDIDPWWFDEHAEIQPPPDYFEYPSQMQILDFAWRNGLYLVTQQWAMRAPPNLIGGSARLNKSGLRADGSLYSDFRFLDRVPHLLEKQMNEVREGSDERFPRGSQTVSSAAVEEIQRLLDYCSAHHIQLLGYLSTFHPSMYRTLQQAPRVAYIWQLGSILAPKFQKAGAAFFDLQNPAVPGCQVSEYLDAFHESEVCTAKSLIFMARHDSRVAALIDAEKLEGFLSHRRSEWQLAF
jgi:hypothetical protein